jgi:hypothetical protein
MAEDAIVRYNAALNGATQGQLSQMYAHQEAIRLFREEKEEKEKAIKAAEKAAKDEAKALADAEAVLQKALLNEIYEGANEQQKLEDALQKALLNEIYDNAKEQQKVEAEVAQSLADEQAKRDAQELADAKAAADALNEVERQKIRSNIEAWEEEQDTKARYTKAKEQMDIQTINNAANYMGQLADGLEEGSSAYKAAFLVQKGLNIASIIMSAQSASAAALAPPPIGLGPVYGASLAASIQAQAAMNVGMVAGTTLASFEGGGITFDGIRAGGVDGKGGRMAVVHPNEKITDLEKEQPASGNSVTINIQAIDTQTGTEFLMRNRDIIFNAANRSANNKGRRL